MLFLLQKKFFHSLSDENISHLQTCTFFALSTLDINLNNFPISEEPSLFSSFTQLFCQKFPHLSIVELCAIAWMNGGSMKRWWTIRHWIIVSVDTVYILLSVYIVFGRLCCWDPGTGRHLIFCIFSPHSFLISASFRHATNCISFEKFGFVTTTNNFSCFNLPWWLKGYFSCLSTMRPIYFRTFLRWLARILRLQSEIFVGENKNLKITIAVIHLDIFNEVSFTKFIRYN